MSHLSLLGFCNSFVSLCFTLFQHSNTMVALDTNNFKDSKAQVVSKFCHSKFNLRKLIVTKFLKSR